MICYVCGQPAVGQCQSCWRFYCKEHGDITCKNCAAAAPGGLFGAAVQSVLRFEDQPPAERGERRRRARPSWPRPPTLRTLERVIPVAMSQSHGRTELTVVSLECYDDGILVNYAIRGGPPSPRPKLGFAVFHTPDVSWQATDDASTVYEGLPISGGGDAGGFRGSVSFSPRLNPAASVLRLRVEEVRWIAHGPGQKSSVDAGPWRFDVPLQVS